MEGELLTCNMEYLSFSAIAVLSIFILIAARRFLRKALELLPFMKQKLTALQRPVVVNLHWEVAELRKINRKISDDWKEMIQLMFCVRDQQSTLKEHMKSEMGLISSALQDNAKKSEEENSKNRKKLEEHINIFKGDLSSLKETIRNQGEMLRKVMEQYRPSRSNLAHMWTQTEHEILIKTKVHDTRTLEDKIAENDLPKTTGIRKVLLEFQKEARKNSLKEREEAMSHIEAILNQINQDRDFIKTAIQQAFAASSYQSQNSLEQFGTVGQEALQCVVKKTEKSNMLMKDKFQEFDKKLKVLFEEMHNTSFDVSAIKSTLDNIDSQLDDIFQRIELGCQKNVEHCEEVLGGLETATEVWKESSSHLNEMAQLLAVITSGVEQLMNELSKNTDDSKELLLPMSQQQEDKSALNAITLPVEEAELHEHTLSLKIFLHLQNMAQICSGKVSSLNDRLENGTSEITMAIENLLHQIHFMCDLVENVSKRFNFLETQSIQERPQVSQKKNQDKELLGDLNVNKDVKKSTTITEDISNITADPNSYKATVEPNFMPPKKTKASMKLRNPTSPVKKEKTIYSDISSFRTYSKNIGTVRK